ncbi:sugar-phosphatase [Spirochaetia bacterium]|nr:sugar-phosphatase [Spirochaetia bacterium]
MDIRLVVSDIDDTLIRKDEPVPPAVISAAARLAERGIPLTFASGRLPYMIAPYMELLYPAADGRIPPPAAACNGALIWQHNVGGGALLSRHPMGLSGLRPLAEEARRLGMTILYALDGLEYCLEETEHSRARRKIRQDYPTLRPLNDAEWDSLGADKMNIIDDDREAERVRLPEDMVRSLEGQYAITRYGWYGLEIVAHGVNKAAGAAEIAARMGIAMEQVMAIGDSENDNLLLQRAGWGVAVANAAVETKVFADYVCRREAGDGVAEAIERFCL